MQVYCWAIIGHGVLYFALFANFYAKSYMGKKNLKNKKNQKNQTDGALTNGHVRKGQDEEEENEVEEEEENEEEYRAEISAKEILKKLE